MKCPTRTFQLSLWRSWRQYEISLSGKGDSLLKFVQGLEAMDKRLVVDSISYDGQGQSKYVIKLHFFD